MNYEEDIRIDETALDVEWLEQPNLMYRYAKYAADTKLQLDEAKERMEVVRARLDAAIRSNPEEYGVAKVTESAIQGAIILQDEYQTAVKAYNDARYEHEVSMAAVRAMDQRKTALENLVRLLTASYFAGPQAPRDLSKEALDRQNQKNQNRKIRMTQQRKS